MLTIDSIELFLGGDTAIVIQFGNTSQSENVSKLLDKHPFAEMVEYIAAFTTVTVSQRGLNLQ